MNIACCIAAAQASSGSYEGVCLDPTVSGPGPRQPTKVRATESSSVSPALHKHGRPCWRLAISPENPRRTRLSGPGPGPSFLRPRKSIHVGRVLLSQPDTLQQGRSVLRSGRPCRKPTAPSRNNPLTNRAELLSLDHGTSFPRKRTGQPAPSPTQRVSRESAYCVPSVVRRAAGQGTNSLRVSSPPGATAATRQVLGVGVAKA
jgi:hypothetical protein